MGAPAGNRRKGDLSDHVAHYHMTTVCVAEHISVMWTMDCIATVQ